MNKQVKEQFDTIKIEYNRIGLRWDTESIRYLIGKGYEGLTKSFNTLRIPDPINTVGLVECAVKNKDKANKIIDSWSDKGYGLALLHVLMVNDLREQGFFKSTTEMEMIIELTSKNESLKDLGTQILTEEIANQIKEVQSLT